MMTVKKLRRFCNFIESVHKRWVCSSKCLEKDDFLLYYAINSFVMRLNWRNFSSCSRVTCKTSIHDLYPPSPSSSPLFLMKHVAALYYKVLLAKKLNSKLCLSWKYYVLKGPSILRKKCGCNAHKKRAWNLPKNA